MFLKGTCVCRVQGKILSTSHSVLNPGIDINGSELAIIMQIADIYTFTALKVTLPETNPETSTTEHIVRFRRGE